MTTYPSRSIFGLQENNLQKISALQLQTNFGTHHVSGREFPGAISPGLELPELEHDRSPLSTFNIKNVRSRNISFGLAFN